MIETERLILRQWQDSDYEPFSAINSDKKVMEYFPEYLNKEQSDAMAEKIRALIEEKGWGFWACELKITKEFIGFVGLNDTSNDMPFTASTEIGWRLGKQHWGNGYATEAANRCLTFAFTELACDGVIAFTAIANKRSIDVMERLEMEKTEKNFQHPKVPEDSNLKEHVLYKISKNFWKEFKKETR